MKTDNDLLLKVLCGEATPAALPDSAQRQKAQAALATLTAAFAAPALPVGKLKQQMQKVDAARMSARPSSRVSKIVLLSIGVAAAAMILFGVLLRGPVEVRPVPAQVAPQFVDNHWILPHGTIMADGGQFFSDGKLVELTMGRAEIATTGDTASYEPVLKLLKGQMQISVRGKSRAAARVFGSSGAVSVFDGPADSVACGDARGQAPLYMGANQDAVFTSAGGKLQTAFWPDTTAKMPPVVAADIYIRVATGRVVRGVVKQSMPNGILFVANGHTDEAPESLLAEEITGWTPAETPRGRDTYARWLSELIPAQLKHISVNWNALNSAREIGAEEFLGNATIVPDDERLPEVEYTIRDNNGDPTFVAKPTRPDLGGGWQIDAKLNITREKAHAATGENF